MSDSRLEKFIYAICSMEVSDLPAPLSRIEKLWNCLITGETPDFEPLSRNEKYLMAMLDRYDISNLPAPMSRGEKLLYKIAVGETDLSDVPGYLSRYEELLKYLIENGGISGGDFEYVLHTLNQSMYTLYTTAEKPVKRAILKGQTLVNIDSYYDRNDFYNFGADYIDEDGFIQLTARGAWINAHTRNNSLVKPNTKYAIIVDIKENTLDSSTSNALKICTNTDTLDSVWSDINGIEIAGGVTGRLFFTATTSNNVSSVKMLQRAYIGSALKTGHIKYRWMIIEYQKGMENWDIPYFRGMTSVKMPVLTTTNLGNLLKREQLQKGNIHNANGKDVDVNTIRSDFIKREFDEYTLSHNSSCWTKIFEYDEQKQFIKKTNTNSIKHSTTMSDNTKFIRIVVEKSYELVDSLDIKLCPYTSQNSQPYKSNILTVNEDVTLREIGDVKDELNCLTGELTHRIGEIVLNGSEEWRLNAELSTTNGYYAFYYCPPDAKLNPSFMDVISDKFSPTKNNDMINEMNSEYITFHGWSYGIIIAIKGDKLVNGFNQWLSQNPVTAQYELATESVKTVALTVVDQDNQPTQLGTFENITHVSLEAENLIPEVEMEVATIISEELASASPLMDDISTKQEQLNTTVDEQSNNVDATMIATTEIFEEIL